MPRILILFLLVSLLMAGCAGDQAQPIQIQNAWARPALSGQTSAIYFTIENPNSSSDQLLEASTSAAAMTELHKSTMNAEGVMSMQQQNMIEIPANGQVMLEPGGLHVMLMNLKQDLKVGDTLELVLKFKNSAPISLQVPVNEAP